jgi:aryl-alcohol dehydrogenase-like predicted oxidoreductase
MTKIINSGGCIHEDTCQEIVQLCSQAGVTLYDTAEGYGGGTSEKRVGRLLATSPDAIYMTKFLPVPWRAFHSDLEKAARASCRRLQVDCIPIYLLHSPVHWRPIEYWVEACAMCKQKGLIHAMGLCNCNAQQVERADVAGKKYGVPVIYNQVHYSLLDYNSHALKKKLSRTQCQDCWVFAHWSRIIDRWLDKGKMEDD